jgi:hypothetical protein
MPGDDIALDIGHGENALRIGLEHHLGREFRAYGDDIHGLGVEG